MQTINSGIYMILNIITNKCYVGSTKFFKTRRYQHFNELRKNKHYNEYLQRSWNKHREENFKFIVLERIEDISLLNEREIYWIKEKNCMSHQNGYNMGIPQQGSLEICPITSFNIKKAHYNRHYPNQEISFSEWLQGKRYKHLKLQYAYQKEQSKPVLVLNRNNEIITEYSSQGELKRAFSISDTHLRTTLDKNKTFKTGRPSCIKKLWILIRKEDYDENIDYSYNDKSKVYVPKGKFKGHPVETYNIETNITIKQYVNKFELAKEFGVTNQHIGNILCGNRKRLRDVGVRYSKQC